MSDSPFKSSANLTSGLSTVIGITLVLTMLGVLAVLLFTTDSVSKHFKEDVSINLMMKSDVPEPDILKFKKLLETEQFSSSAVYISKDKAAKIQTEELGEDFVSFLGENPLPASIDLHLNAKYTRLDSIDWIIADLNKNAMIYEVVYHPGLIKAMNDNLSKIGFGLLIFSALLLFIAVALINNTIRLAVFSKRFIIKSMQLVGATHGFIRRPFILKGIWYGFISAIFALGIISGLLYLLKEQIPEIPQILAEGNYLIMLVVFLFATGVFIAWISTQLAVRKYIRMRQDQMY